MNTILQAGRKGRTGRSVALGIAMSLCLLGTARAAPGSFGDVYPRGNPDGIISLGDLLLVRAFALGSTVPTAAELNAANVFPLAPCVTCVPGEVRVPDFAARIIGGSSNIENDPGDITLGDVLVIEKAILGEIILGNGLALLSAGAISPSSGDTFGGQPVSISGNGFAIDPGRTLRVSFVFPQEPGPAVRIECDVPAGVTPSSVDCGHPGFAFISISNSQIQLLTPDASGQIGPGEFEVSAAVQVSILETATSNVLQSTSDVLTAQNSYTFARGALSITALGGEKQAGFPLIELGTPLITFVYDLVELRPATSNIADPLAAPYVTYAVDIVGNCPALLNDSDFEVTAAIGDDGRSQVRLTPLDTCPSGKIVVTAVVTNIFGTPIIPTTQTSFEVPIAAADQGVLQIVSGSGQICPFDTTCSLNLSDPSPVPEPLTVSIIDRFGTPVQGGSGITVLFAEQAGQRIGGLTPPALSIGTGTDSCSGTPLNLQCTETGPDLRVNFTTGGSSDPGTTSGEYVVLATAVGNPKPASFTNIVPVIPATGLTFRVRAERATGMTIEYTNEAAQADREADLVDDKGPFPMGVRVLDQWGRPAENQPGFPVCVTYSANTSGFAVAPTFSYTGGDPSECPGDAQVPPAQVAVLTASGLVSENLTFDSAGAGGVMTVSASITSRPSAFVNFRFALGLNNRPPPPVNLSRVEVFHGIQNTLAPAVSSDGTAFSSFIVRGALGSVVKGPDDTAPFGSGTPPTFTRYSVQVTDGGAITACTNVSNGLTGGVGLDGTGDVNQGRFQVTLTPEPTTGQLAISVWDGPGCIGEQSVPRIISFTSRFDVGYVSNRTLSQLDRIGIDFAASPPVVSSVDTDQTFGTQSIRTSGVRPLGIAFFSTDPSATGPDGQTLYDRAVVVNSGSGDISVIRVAEEILVQGNDLELVGGTTGNVVQSSNSDFLVERNYRCNSGVDLDSYVPDTSDDCSVSAGDVLIVRPGEILETRRIITAVLGTPGSATQLVLNGDLTPVQVSSPGVNFRIVSRYREIDADNDWCTTSRRAESGVSRIRVPYPDRNESVDNPPSGPCLSGQYPEGSDEPDLITYPGRLVAGETVAVSPRYVAAYFPEGGISYSPDVIGRIFVSDPVYNVLYVYDVREYGDGQIEFVRPGTNVPTSGTPQPDGVLPVLALRTPEYDAALSFAGPTHLTVDIQDSDGDSDLDDEDDAYLYVVVESDPSSGGPLHGGLAVFALNPDGESSEDAGDEWTDATIRFPFQANGACGGSPCYPYVTSLCQMPANPLSREWAACEVDTDFDPYTNSYASTTGNVCLDVDGDQVPDPFIALNPNSTCGGTANVDAVSVPVPDPVRNTGMTMILARQTSLPGDFLSDQFTLAFSPEITGVYRDSTRPLRYWQPFRFEKPDIPATLQSRVRRDLGFLSVRTTSNDPTGDNLNDRPQLVYPVDVRPDKTRLSSVYPSVHTIAFDNTAGGTGAGQSYSNVQCVMDPNPRIVTGAGADQRDGDDIVTVPLDRTMAVTGLDANGLWGPDGVARTTDDLVHPQDVLLLKTTLGDRIYRYTVVSVSNSEKIRFTVRTDACDGVPTQTVSYFRIMDSMNVVDLRGDFGLPDLPVGIELNRTIAARSETLGGGIGRAFAHFASVRDRGTVLSGPNADRDDRFTLMTTVSLGEKTSVTGITPTTVALVNLYDPGSDADDPADDLGCFRFANGIPDSGPLTVAQEALCAEMEGDNELVPGDTVINLAAPPDNTQGGAIVIAASEQLGFLFNSSTSQILQFRHTREAADIAHASLPWLKARPYPTISFPEVTFEAKQSYPNLFPGAASGVWTTVAHDLPAQARLRYFFTNPVSNSISVIEQRDFTGVANPIYVARAVDTDNITGEQSIRINTGLLATGPAPRLDKIERSFLYGPAIGESVLFVTENQSDTQRYDLNVVDPQIDTELDQNQNLAGVNGLSTDATPDGTGAEIHSVIVDEGRERVYTIVKESSSAFRLAVHDLNTGAAVNLTSGITECTTSSQIRFTSTATLPGAVPQSFAIRDNLLLVGFSNSSSDSTSNLFWMNLDNLKSADFEGTSFQCVAKFQSGVANRTVARASNSTDRYPASIQAIRIEGDRALVAGVTGANLKLSVIDLSQFWRWRSGSGCSETVCAPRDGALIPTNPVTALTVESGGGANVVDLRNHGAATFLTVTRSATPNSRIYAMDSAQFTAAPSGGANVVLYKPVIVARIDAPGSLPTASLVGPSWLVIPNRTRDALGNNLTLVNLKTPVWNRTTPPLISGSSIRYYSVGADGGEIRDFEFTTLPPP